MLPVKQDTVHRSIASMELSGETMMGSCCCVVMLLFCLLCCFIFLCDLMEEGALIYFEVIKLTLQSTPPS